MKFDATTLMVAGSLVGALSGIILAGAWAAMREERALLWWALASCAYSIGVGLLAFASLLPQPLGSAIAVGIMACAPPLIWGGTRIFEHRKASVPILLAGPLAWLLSGIASAGATLIPVTVGFAAWIGYLSASAFELWRGRGEKLGARWYLLGLFVLHATVTFGGVVDALNGRFAESAAPGLGGWFGIIHIEGLIYFVGTAISMVGLAQQRKEHRAVHIAGLDVLTGTANRGTFLAAAERLLRRAREDGAPVSLIMFDLDHFKAINDTHGHLAGDAVIRLFAETMRRALRASDLVGRYGGEEFAVVLPGTAIEVACVIGDRIRHSFAERSSETEVRATVSGGVAFATDGMTLLQLIDAADRALYRAKHLGRNRIQRGDDAPPRDNIIRVA